jgi:competence protein ComEA
MNSFTKSFLPLLKRLKLKRYLVEIILLIIAVIITISSLVLYIKNTQENSGQETFVDDQSGQILPEKIFVDVSGAVKKPNFYQINFGARIKEVVDKAGGLSNDADVMFFNRNFNLARIVTDQEKIYIPSITEINNGIFVQNQLVLDYISPVADVVNNTPTTNASTDNQLISLNFATIEELDQLPGIGQVTANKIITGRPYTTLEELLTKKVVNKGVFEKIKNLISIN